MLTKIRCSLIKKYLHNLLNSGKLVKVTGRGLNGSFKLVDKTHFLKEINDTTNVRNAEIPKNRISKNRNNVPIEDIKMLEREVLTNEQGRLSSIDDTPMTRLRSPSTSTPFVTNKIVPGAPEVALRTKRKGRNRVQEDEISTPRSSLSNKKRRLNKIAE